MRWGGQLPPTLRPRHRQDDRCYQNRTEEAAALHRKLLPLFQGLFMTSSPIPVKAALKMMGFPVGEPRLPLVPLDAEQEARLQQLLREYGLI